MDPITVSTDAYGDVEIPFDQWSGDLVSALSRGIGTRTAKEALDAIDLKAVRGPRLKQTADEFSKIPPPPVIMQDVLAAEMNILGGPSEAGKSLLARDWALAVASGTHWREHKVTEQRNVLWIASEGLHDFGDRWMRWDTWNDAKGHVFVLDEIVDLVRDNDVDWLLNEYADERPGLVVFDVIYGMGMSDDMGTRDVFPVINAMKKISDAWGAATLALGHPGLNGERRFRGSSAWRQLTYTEWHMADGRLTCEKSKIADKRHLNSSYIANYPSLEWMNIDEEMHQAVQRNSLIRQDIAAYPGDTHSNRARRLFSIMGVSERTARRIISSYTESS